MAYYPEQNAYEDQNAYFEQEQRQKERIKADEEFETAYTEFKKQSGARGELAELMQKHRLHIRCEEGWLEIVQSTYSGDERVIYSTGTKIVHPIDMIGGDLDAE